MKHSRLYIVAAAALLSVAIVLAPSFAQQQQTVATGGTKIGVCDIVQVFNNYSKASDLNADFNQKGQALQAEDTKRGEAIDSLAGELDLLKEGSAEYEQRLNEVQRLTIEREAWVKYQQQVIMRDRHRLTVEMYDEVLAAVAEVAQANGVDVVIYNVRDELKGENTTQLLQEMQDRKVLYASPQADLTETVLAQLNANYRASKSQQ